MKENPLITIINEEIKNISDVEKINNINNRIKNGDNNISADDVVGLTFNEDNIPTFSDKYTFEYHYNLNQYAGKLIDIGSNLYVFDNNKKYHHIAGVEYNIKTHKYETTTSDRIRRYGNTIPKSGEFNVLHGSPNGKIENFDDKMFGQGYQREELPHEKFAGIYTSDDSNNNKILNGGYGDVHTYHIKYDNTISELDAEKLLLNHEKEIKKHLNRIDASNYIKSLGYDMIYRVLEDSNDHEFIILDTNKIKPI